jgi:phosphoribosylaminoimidazolecarboxamide formyltransferase/IMP cyclohydrolase
MSVYNKEGLAPVVQLLHEQGVAMYSTGGTFDFIAGLGLPCIAVEELTDYPAILGGRVKTLHPKVFGGILARRDREEDAAQLAAYDIPQFDLVMVDLYPFEDTVASTSDEHAIIEKIDIGGVSLIRAAAKNHASVLVISARRQYEHLISLLQEHGGQVNSMQRRLFASAAFAECAHYDVAIAQWFGQGNGDSFQISVAHRNTLRYGENPHQDASYYGNLESLFEKLNGKDLSYNNLVDIDAACSLMNELFESAFAIFKHTNVCGVALAGDVASAYAAALSGDPESAFGGVLITNQEVNVAVAQLISEQFFEVLIAPDYEPEALELLKAKKNRILLRQVAPLHAETEYKRVLNGVLVQEPDATNYADWDEKGGRDATDEEAANLQFANIVCKYLKSNAIAIVKNHQLIGKGCGQTSRIDALRQALSKAAQGGFEIQGSVLASDAFFPFDDCVRMAHEAGVTAIVQPGGSIRDADTINYCKEHNIALILTGMRHFRH